MTVEEGLRKRIFSKSRFLVEIRRRGVWNYTVVRGPGRLTDSETRREYIHVDSPPTSLLVKVSESVNLPRLRRVTEI